MKTPDATGWSNLILAGTSAYSMYWLCPGEYPYAFAASAIGFLNGLVQFSNSLLDEGLDDKWKSTARGIMELVPLPLTNIQLYNESGTSNCLGLAHGFFMVPLALYLGKKLIAKDEGGEGEGAGGENMDALKHMTILGNIVSLLFLSVNEDNCLYCVMALSAFAAQYGSKLVEKNFEGWGDSVFALGYSVFNFLTGYVLTNPK